MDYERAAEFRGDPEKALETARTAFLLAGFRFVASDARGFEAEGPGMIRPYLSPLAGASRVRVAADGRSVSVTADLEAVRRLGRFVVWLPIAIGLGVVAILAIVFAVTDSPAPPWVLPLLGAGVVFPHVVIWPVVVRTMRRRTVRALDVVVGNMVVLGQGR